MPREWKRGLAHGMSKVAKFLEDKAKGNFNKPNTPRVRTGALRRSIASGSDGLSAWIASNLKYARIQEMGGVITARRKPYLTFKVGNSWVSKKSVTIPARPYLQTAIKNNIDRVVAIIEQEITEELN